MGKNSITKGFIKEIIFNNEESLCIEKDNIIIFVGPNNAGKSQLIKDINNICSEYLAPIVLNNIETEIINQENLLETIEPMTVKIDHGGRYSYNGFGYSISSTIFSDKDFRFRELCDFFISYINTENRLILANPATLIDKDKPHQHPIHLLLDNHEYRKILSDYFLKAFGENIIPNRLFGMSIPLCIGEQIKLDDTFTDEQERQDKYTEILNSYRKVHEQGDGIRAFVGILLNLMIETKSIYLIDEPETFLHPPQAKIMGHILGELLENERQAFIATHSQDIIKGLLETCPRRVKIVRITRTENTNQFAILDNEKISEIWADPLLKYSEIMNSIFYNSVVLCESDADCKMYSIVLSNIKEQSDTISDTLFIHCGGKQRMAKIISALKSLNIKLITVPDIDVLNDETIIKGIVESAGGNWENHQSDYKILNSNIVQGKNIINRKDTKDNILKILDSNTTASLTKAEISEIEKLIKVESKWSAIKKSGSSSIPAGDAMQAYERLDSTFKDLGIFMVPVGELENFIKSIGAHGPQWVNNVLEQYPDLNNEKYNALKSFISSWNI